MDKRLALMCGIDIPIPECQIVIHQPRIKEISYIGEEDFFSGIQCLCLNKSMFVKDESDLQDTNNFQIFMMIMTEKKAADKKFAVQQVCTLLFPEYKVLFTPRSIILNSKNEQFIIDENNFENLQSTISDICCLKTGPMDQQAFNPGDAAAREIAEKLMRGRQRVAAQKGETNTSIFTQYLSTLAIGLGSMSLQELTDLTMYQFKNLLTRAQAKYKYDLDIRMIAAGADPKKIKPKHWFGKLDY